MTTWYTTIIKTLITFGPEPKWPATPKPMANASLAQSMVQAWQPLSSNQTRAASEGLSGECAYKIIPLNNVTRSNLTLTCRWILMQFAAIRWNLVFRSRCLSRTLSILNSRHFSVPQSDLTNPAPETIQTGSSVDMFRTAHGLVTQTSVCKNGCWNGSINSRSPSELAFWKYVISILAGFLVGFCEMKRKCCAQTWHAWWGRHKSHQDRFC